MKIITIVLAFVWAGLILGISFIETPLKFRAPNVTREIGLGIGKIVFTAINRVEIVMAVVILIGLIVGRFGTKATILYAIPLGMLFIQSVWLLPVLNMRADRIISGQTLQKSYHHIAFIIIEITKLITLLLSGIYLLKTKL